MNNFFIQGLTPSLTATGATTKDKLARQKAQQAKLTATLNALNKLLTRSFVKTVQRRRHKKTAPSRATIDSSATDI